VSRSAYYDWLSRKDWVAESKGVIKEKIARLFRDSGNTYGPDRICGLLRKKGLKASYRKVSSLMAELGLSSVHNRQRSRSLTNSKKARGDEYKNLVRGKRFNLPY